MVRVSIYYDNDKKEQFFMVRGDERYARSTKTILELVSTDQELLYFNAVFQVNVLRDVGEGSIVLMDNDVVVPVLLYIDGAWIESEVIPWNSQLNGVEFKLNNLTYDVDHNLTAKYIGNKSCSPSLSNNLLVNITDTHRTVPVITPDSTIQYNKGNIVKTITLSNDLSETYNRDQDIIVYYDDTLVETVNTGETGTVNITIPTGDEGLHTITLDYQGSTNLLPKTVTQQVSIGYNLQLTQYPSVLINGESQEFKGVLQDWFGNPKPNVTVAVQYLDCYTTPQWHEQEIATTNANGEVTINHETITTCKTSYHRLKGYVGGATYSEQILLNMVIPQTLNISTISALYKGQQTKITIKTNSPYENTPIILTGAVNETIYTGSDGFTAVKNLIGDGKGEKTITARFGNLTKTINLPDYIQFWMPNDIHPSPEQYTLLHGNLLKLNSYFRIDLDTLYNEFRFKLPVPKNKPFKLWINGITTNASCLCYLAYGNDIFGENIQSIQYSNGTIEIRRDSQNNITANIYNGDYESQTQVNYNGDEIGFAMGNINPNTKLQCSFRTLYYYEG